MNASPAPIIIIGMHRSGTSLLARLLHQAGVFMGARRTVHSESRFFLRRNREIFQLAHASWDHPAPMPYLMRTEEVRAALLDRLRAQLRSPLSIEYSGWRRYLRYRGAWTEGSAWGWKEPRTTFTLPLWLALFPDARVIHIYRNGVAVAASLRERERTRQKRLANPFFSCRCLHLDGAFSLWVEYESMCQEVMSELAAERCLRVQYEALLAAPERCIPELLKFAGATDDAETISSLTAQIRPSRADAFLKDSEFRAFYEANRGHPLMQHYGYDE